MHSCLWNYSGCIDKLVYCLLIVVGKAVDSAPQLCLDHLRRAGLLAALPGQAGWRPLGWIMKVREEGIGKKFVGIKL